MMKKQVSNLFRWLSLGIVFLFLTTNANAQDKYYITFGGTGDASVVENVTVENLTRKTSLTLPGDKTLTLKMRETGIEDINKQVVQTLLIYPNPSNGTSLMRFSLPKDGDVSISLYDMAGKLHKQASLFLEQGIHTFRLPDMATGVYLLSVRSAEHASFGKWVSMSASAGNEGEIQYSNTTPLEEVETAKTIKATEEEYEMSYSENDLLRFTGQSGNYRTIVMKRPDQDQQIDFRFLACTDGSGNHYPIVEIAGNYWMAEDFKGAKDATGANYGIATSAQEWKDKSSAQSLITGKDFGNYDAAFGYFYNYAAAADALPAKWRMPSKEEFEALYTAMGRENMADAALGLINESDSAVSLWGGLPQSSYRNETGFGAKAAGYIGYSGYHYSKNAGVAYWTSVRASTPYITGYNLQTTTSSIYSGFKIRGIYDETVSLSKKYTITFSGYGQENTVSSVRVENITQNTSITVPGNQALTLVLNGIAAGSYTMNYTENDLLRFIASSGDCSTIITKRPMQSEQLNFKFIICKDVNGNNYSIIDVNGLYWMADDLVGGGTAQNPVFRARSAKDWADSTAKRAVKTMTDFGDTFDSYGVFFNYAAAEASVPEGWRLPTKEEFEALYAAMGREPNANVALGLLMHGADNVTLWNNVPASDYRNETGFGAMATGYISGTPAHLEKNISTAYWTSTPNGNNIYTPYITKTSATITSSPKTSGMKVRCVVGSSVQTLENVFGNLPPGTQSGEKPVGEKYVMIDNYKDLFVTVGEKDKNTYVRRVAANNISSANGNSTASVALPSVPSGEWGRRRIKKAVAQCNANGRENMVIAILNVDASNYGNNTYGNTEASTTLYIFGDAASNYAYSQVTLSGTLPVAKVGKYDGKEMGWGGSNGDNEVTRAYNSMRWFYDVKTCDINGDFVDDFIISARHKIAVYNGSNYSLIGWKDFSSDYPSITTNNAFYTRVVTGDVNGDGTNDILVLTQAPKSNAAPKLRIYLDGDLSTPSKLKTYTLPAFLTGKGINITLGDVTGDRKKEIIINAKALVDKVGYDTKSSFYSFTVGANYALSNFDTLLSNITTSNRSLLDPINMVYFDGLEADPYLVSGNRVFQKSGTVWQEVQYSNSENALIRNNNEAVLVDEVAISAFSDDTREQLVYLVQEYDDKENIMTFRFGKDSNSNNFSRHEKLKIYRNDDGDLFSPGSNEFPAIATVRSSRAAKVLSFKRYDYMYTNLQVNALLAASPYQPGKMDIGKTSFGKSSSSGSETTTEHSITASVIFGFEQEFSIPLIGVKAGGIDFTTKASYGYTKSYSNSKTVMKTTTHTIDSIDHVVVSAILYNCYFYNIEKSDNPGEIGKELMMAYPSGSIETVLTLDRYNEATKNDPKAPKLDNIFTHTAGNPFSYPKVATNLSNLTGNEQFCIPGETSDIYVQPGASGASEKTVEITEVNSDKESHSFNMDIELVVNVGGVKFGAGFGYGNTNSVTKTTGVGTKACGNVPYPPAGTQGFTNFSWNIVFYNYKVGDVVFPVVNYTVY
jgi:uncharacterized protein (TIGR02145 family)